MFWHGVISIAIVLRANHGVQREIGSRPPGRRGRQPGMYFPLFVNLMCTVDVFSGLPGHSPIRLVRYIPSSNSDRSSQLMDVLKYIES